MKKITALILALLMLIFAIACNDTVTPGGDTTPASTPAPTTPPDVPSDSTQLYAGFGRVEITPPHDENGKLLRPIEMATNNFAESVYNDIYATAVAIHDGTTTILLLTLDLRDMRHELYEKVAAAITEETGIPKEQILVSTTHNHSAPELSILIDMVDIDALVEYEKFIIERIPQAAAAAIDDLADATMSAGRSKTDRISFIRRYQLDDGRWTSHVRDKTGKVTTNSVAHEGEIDEELQVLKLEREGFKDIIMVNWQCHPASMSPGGTINADWVHYLRKNIEEESDAYLAFFQGAMGNVNNTSFIKGEAKITSRGDMKLREIANELTTAVNEALEAAEPLPSGPIRTKFDVLPNSRSDRDGRIKSFTTTIGDFALASSPFEMFCQQGRLVKDNSPAEMTFFVTVSNGYDSYIPPEEFYSHGGYEVDCSRWKDDTDFADVFINRIINNIKRLYAKDH